MKIALPLTAAGAFALHYGSASRFAVFEVDPKRRAVRRQIVIAPRASAPCGWPPLLRAAGADLVLAGGMGRQAQVRMAEYGLRVMVGVGADVPAALIAAWLAGTLAAGKNVCDGGAHADEGGNSCDHGHGCGCSHR